MSFRKRRRGVYTGGGPNGPASINIMTEIAAHAITGVRGKAAGATLDDITCEALDGLGARITDPVPNATISILTDPMSSGAAATLSGTTTVSAVDGVWTFSGLSINKENTSTMVLRITCGSVTDDTNAFCIYHPVFDNSRWTSGDYLWGFSLINTVGPNGRKTIDTVSSKVRAVDPMVADGSVYVEAAAATNNPTIGAWNAPPTFGSDDALNVVSSALGTLVAAARDTEAISLVADQADASSGSICGLGHISRASDGLYAFSMRIDESGGTQTLYQYDTRDSTPLSASINITSFTAGSPYLFYGAAQKNTAIALRAGASSATGNTTANIQTQNQDVFAIGRRYPTAFYYGAGATSNPRIWDCVVHDANLVSSVNTWRTEEGTDYGISL